MDPRVDVRIETHMDRYRKSITRYRIAQRKLVKNIRIARRRFRRFGVEVNRTKPLLHNGKKPR